MKKLSKEGISDIKKFSKLANYNEYNSNVVTMFMWDHVYEVFYEVHENFLLILVNYHHRLGWLMPLCEEKYLKDAFHEMEKLSIQSHIPYEIHGMNQQLKDYCEQHDIHFVYHLDIDAQDYVYSIDMHRTLTGKKMQKRRNHLNAFIKEHPNFEYRSLTKEHQQEVFDFLNHWKLTHKSLEAIEREMIGIQRLFSLWDELQLMGGAIYIENELKAFCIYSELSENTLQMHIEKADHSIRGLYVAILKYTLMNCPSQYEYLNREEDMGLDYLRKAKTDLHPLYKIKKYIAYRGDTTILPAENHHIPEIKKLWLDSFPDEDEQSTAFFFDHLFHLEDAFLLMHHMKLMGMIQVRKMTIHKDEKDQKVGFIVGVAINPYYQGCGYMKQLMNHVLQENKFPILCIQAYNWELYKPFGFSEAYTATLSTFKRQGEANGQRCDDASHLLKIYQSYTSQKDGYRVRDLSYYENYLIPYKQLDSEIIANDSAYLIVNQEHTLVSECIYTNEEAAIALLNNFNEIKVISDLIFDHRETKNMMMVRGDFHRSSHLFINEFL